MSQEYADRLKVLQALDYIDKNDMITLKGKVACEINHQVRKTKSQNLIVF